MALKLKVGAFIDAPVNLVIRDGSKEVKFSFTLVVNRLAQDDALAMHGRLIEIMERERSGDATPSESTNHTRDLLLELIHDWRDQRLVLDDDDRPAPYSTEALDVMLQLAGAGSVLLTAAFDRIKTAVRGEDKERRGN